MRIQDRKHSTLQSPTLLRTELNLSSLTNLSAHEHTLISNHATYCHPVCYPLTYTTLHILKLDIIAESCLRLEVKELLIYTGIFFCFLPFLKEMLVYGMDDTGLESRQTKKFMLINSRLALQPD